MGGKCQRCGWKPKDESQYAAIHFHHRNGIRNWDVGNSLTRSWESLTKEMELCELLCANCHTIEHLENPIGTRTGRPPKPNTPLVEHFVQKLKGQMEGGLVTMDKCS